MRLQRHLFKDRPDAAVQLKELLPLDQMKSEGWNLIAVSSGGLMIAHEINKRLKLPIDYRKGEHFKSMRGKNILLIDELRIISIRGITTKSLIR